MKTIVTRSGRVKLLDAPVEVLRLVRAYLPFGAARFAQPQNGADFGLVMQCGEREAHAIKQQHPDSDERDGDLWFRTSIVLIASSLASYARHGLEGLLMPCAYRKAKEGGRVEAGIAYFGHAAPSGPETLKSADKPKVYDEQFGPGFFVMIEQFIQCLVESAARTRIPVQDTIIGLDIRKRSQLGSVNFGFLVVGPHIVCTKAQIVDGDPIWDFLAGSGVSEVYHMPCIPLEIPEEMLATAKPTG